MITRYEHGGVQWIDVERPTIEEAEQLADEFKLGASAAQEMAHPTLKPRVDQYPDFIYVVLHFPAMRDTHGAQADHEVDLIVGKEFLITVHYETVPAVHDFARSFEATMLMNRARGSFHSGHVIFELASRLYQSVENELESIEDSVVSIEKEIFSGNERAMVQPISITARELLNHKRLIGSQEEVLREFQQSGVLMFGEQFKNYMSSMTALHYRVYNHALTLMDTLSELRSTNDSLLSTRQNEITKNLTVVASIMLPLSLIASVFGMNTVHNPIIGDAHDFWILIGIMAVIGMGTVWYFVHKRWF